MSWLAGLAFVLAWVVVGRLEQGIRWSWIWARLGPDLARGDGWVGFHAVLWPKLRADGGLGYLVDGRHLRFFWRWPIEIKFYPPHPRIWYDRVAGD